jgi:hypothetical protein
VILGIYPLPQLDFAEITAIAEDLLPYTTRLGLEQYREYGVRNTRVETHGFYKIKIRGRASEGFDRHRMTIPPGDATREEDAPKLGRRPESTVRRPCWDSQGDAEAE